MFPRSAKGIGYPRLWAPLQEWTDEVDRQWMLLTL